MSASVPALLRNPFLRLSALAVLLVFHLGCPRAWAKDQVPDWVREAAAVKSSGYPPETNAVVLLDDVSYAVTPDGGRIEHVRRVVRVLRPGGRRSGALFAHFSNTEKLHYVHLWSIGPDGKEYAVKDGELSESGAAAGFELYSDGRRRGGMPPAMDPGGVAAIEYELQERPYDNDIIWIPAEDLPLVKERLTLSLPAGYTFTAAWKGRKPADAVDLEAGRTLWEVRDAPALRFVNVPLAPEELSVAPRLDIFYAGPVAGPYGTLRGDWKDIGMWYEALAKDRNKPDAAIAAKAQELVQGRTGFHDRVEAIANFVQGSIRYVAIEIGVGGYQPHPAAEIYRARYGDCKDKATLLSAMLNAVGIRSTWVLVHSERGVISHDAPSLMGNHMIAAIELPEGYPPEGLYSIVAVKGGKRFLLFDPTWEKTPFGHLERELQGSDGLLIDGANSQAIRLPVLAPELNRTERTARFKLAADGSLSGTVREEEMGDVARNTRYTLGARTEKEQQEVMDHRVARDLMSASVTDLHAEHADDLAKPVVLSYALRADHFAQNMGPLTAIRPRVLGQDGLPVDAKRREVTVDLQMTRQVHDDIVIDLPEGVAVDELPRAVNLDLGFAAYRSESRVENRAIHYSRTFTVREIVLPAERYPDVQKLAQVIATDEQNSAILKHSN